MIDSPHIAAKIWSEARDPGTATLGELKIRFLTHLATHFDHLAALDILLRIEAIDESLKGPDMYDIQKASAAEYVDEGLTGPSMYEIQGETIVGASGREYDAIDLLSLDGSDNDAMMGLSWKSVKKRAKKSYNKVNWVKVAKVTRIVGPVIATVYPPAAPAIAVAMVLAEAAAKGDIKAIAKEENIKLMADNGVPVAQEAYGALQTAKALQRNLKAEATIKAAQYGSKGALRQMSAVNFEAKAGNATAIKAMAIYKDASKGMRLKPKLRAKYSKKKRLSLRSITRGNFLTSSRPSYVHRGGVKVEVLSPYQAGL